VPEAHVAAKEIADALQSNEELDALVNPEEPTQVPGEPLEPLKREPCPWGN
jgi:hypothetical protein